MRENDLFCGNNPKLIEHNIIDFIVSLKRKGLGYFAIRNYVMTIISFYKINDIVLNTKKIGKFMPEYKRVKKDRAYTREEIHKMLQIADERMGVIILLLASSGMRLGAISPLKLRNLQDKEITVYENSKKNLKFKPKQKR
jgi:integrase